VTASNSKPGQQPSQSTSVAGNHSALPAAKTDFIGLQGGIHLASGGQPPLLQKHRCSFEAFARDKAAGYEGFQRHWQMAQHVRQRLVKWLGVSASQIALLGNSSDAIARVAGSFNWQAGDNVVVSELDYASGRFALASLRRHGVELRLVPAQHWRIGSESLLNHCDSRTRLVYASQVTSLTAEALNIEMLSSQLSNSGTALLVDASHALGVLPVRAELADFTVASCYKFALGIHDGLLAWNQQRWPEFQPAAAGWWSARQTESPANFEYRPGAIRAEYGNANHLGTYMLNDSLDYLDRYGVDAIASHALELTAGLIDGMHAAGLDVITPAERGNHGASAAFLCDDESFVSRAAERGIYLWGDNGRVRASAHLFNSASEISEFNNQLPELLGTKWSG